MTKQAQVIPRLSIIVVAFRMPEQLARTLFTLSTAYQRNVSASDYEVIVVENRSDRNLPQETIEQLDDNVTYVLRDEPGKTPVHALNEGIGISRGETLGIMIDGAHMLTPRIVEHVLACSRSHPNSLIGVPVHHLGPEEQHESTRNGYNVEVQDALLESIDWREDGYELMSISVWCSAHSRGFMHPISESNCFFAPRSNLEMIGGADTRFDYEGGGAINLHMYRALGLLPGTAYILLMGEASFHQFHGGVTSNETREQVVDKFFAQLNELWHGDYRALTREPIFYGTLSRQAQTIVGNASHFGARRLKRFYDSEQDPWFDRPVESIEKLPFKSP